MIYVFIVLSVVLLAVSCIVHALTFTQYPVLENLPFIWILHVLIFVVFIPAIFYSKKYQKLEGKT